MSAPRSLALLLCLTLAAPALSQAPPVERVWLLDSAGLNWRAEDVRLGNHGTAVFAPVTLNNSRHMLLSRHDGDPPTAVWRYLTDPAQVSSAAASDDSDCYAVLTRTPTGVLNEDEWRLQRYDSSGLVWTWLAPFQGAGHSVLGVDRAGTRIVTVIHNTLLDALELSAFDVGSSVPTLQVVLPGSTIWSGTLSSDGSRLALALGPWLYVVDTYTGAVLFQKTFAHQTIGVGLGLSADGTVLATGSPTESETSVYTWDGSAYQLAFSSLWPGGGRARCVVVSEDGGTVASASSSGVYPSESVRLEILDVASKSLLAWEQLDSPGLASDNIPIGLDLSDDGSVVAMAITGDHDDLHDELRFYLRDRGVPFATFPVPGKPSSMDLSPDGRWAAFGIDSFPSANPSVQLYRIGVPDLTMHGTPSLGATTSVLLRTASQGPAWVIVAQAALAAPIPYPVAGDLLVDPTGAIQVPIPSGSDRARLWMPTDAALVGSEVWLQGLASRPWWLSEVVIPLVLLP